MLEVTGPSSACCNKMIRRDFLRIGSLTFGGLTLADLLRHRAVQAQPSPDTAVIFIELDGGPSHFETYDPKPEAPPEYRGPFQTINTSVSGANFSELMIEQSRVMDKMAVVRSVSHTSADHGNAAHLINTGYYRRNGQCGPQEMPGVGAYSARMGNQPAKGVPPYVALLGTMRYGAASYLGKAFNPFTVDQDPNAANFNVHNLTCPPNLDFERIQSRRHLQRTLDRHKRINDLAGTSLAMDQFTQRAFEIVSTAKAADAFNLNKESEATRNHYGRTHIGQAMLLARRLVEAGVTFVSVRDREWDDHGQIEGRMKILRPRFDRALAALITDLYQRGLDRRVLLVAMGEFGRTPRINRNAGRDHWAPVMSVVFSGGSLRMGQIIGSSTALGDAPKDNPYRPAHVLSMVYRHLGIDSSITFPDFSGRPRYLLEHHDWIHPLI